MLIFILFLLRMSIMLITTVKNKVLTGKDAFITRFK